MPKSNKSDSKFKPKQVWSITSKSVIYITRVENGHLYYKYVPSLTPYFYEYYRSDEFTRNVNHEFPWVLKIDKLSKLEMIVLGIPEDTWS